MTRAHARIGFGLAGLALIWLALPGCGITDSCDEDTQTQDVIYGSFEESSRALVQFWRDKGYTCSSERLYDAFGRAFGERYTCTGCR